MLGYPPPPPPPPGGGGAAAYRPTRWPPRFGSTKGGGVSPPALGGGGVGVTPPPPPTAPQTVAHPSGSHIGWRRPLCHIALSAVQGVTGTGLMSAVNNQSMAAQGTHCPGMY